MSGDWIKIELASLEKPEVIELARILNLDVDTIFTKLIRVWGWFNEQSKNGHAPVTVASHLDSVVRTKGFCDAMVLVGWMQKENGEIIIPNFDRFNSQTAKERALAAIRAQNYRDRKRHDSITQSSRLDKIREDKNNNKEKNNIKKESSELHFENKKQSNNKNFDGLTDLKNRRINFYFDEFWKIYPKKTGKKNAQKSYQRINPDENLHAEILRAVENITALRWQYTEKQFIPDPATWLNQERWADEIIPVPNPTNKIFSAVDQVAAYNQQAEERRAKQSEIDITNVTSEVRYVKPH